MDFAVRSQVFGGNEDPREGEEREIKASTLHPDRLMRGWGAKVRKNSGR